MATLIERRAVRALLLTPENEVLLIRVKSLSGNVFWIAPGGGIEPGESVEDALRREVREELGLENINPGPAVWLRHHTFNWDGRRISQHEEYRVVHVERFQAKMHDPYELTFSTHLRWWPIRDLDSAVERLTPLSLAQILEGYLRHGAPKSLPPVEVLVD